MYISVQNTNFTPTFLRSGFDTEYMVNNDEETGLISYIGLCLDLAYLSLFDFDIF